MVLASDDTHSMSLQWYIWVPSADAEDWLSNGGESPHYFFAELTLTSSVPYEAGAEITQFFDFWEVDPTLPPGTTSEEVPSLGEEYTFAESVEVTAYSPAVGSSIDIGTTGLTQTCENINEDEAGCPWVPAAADLWENDAKRVKYVVKRRLVDHYVTMPGSSYYIRGGFQLPLSDGTGQISEQRVVGDGMYLPLFDGASMLGLALMSGLFASVTSILI